MYSLAEMVEHGDVGIHVVEIVGVRRVLLVVPVLREAHVRVQHGVLRFRLVVHAVEPDHVLDKPHNMNYIGQRQSSRCDLQLVG